MECLKKKEFCSPTAPEKMEEFFVSRLDIYEHHMLREAAGVAEGYKVLAGYVPADTQTLLDLGCGTGLELEEIFKRCPNARVTGIDLAKAMLDKLREKYAGKQVELICASYLGYDFGTHTYDAAVSCETMHHLSYGEKLALYSNIHKALKPGGRYIECDYMAESQEEEARLSAQSRRIRAEHGIPKGELYHFDTPLTAQNQIKLLTQAGFALAEKLWRTGSTTIIVAQKP